MQEVEQYVIRLCALHVLQTDFSQGRFDTRRKKGQRDVGVSKSSGTQQPWVFLLKMIILGCFGVTTILGNPHVESIPPWKDAASLMAIV